jgi:hypothetical protein
MTSGNVPAPSRFDPEARRKFDAVRKAIDDYGDELRAIPRVVGVRPGYKFQDGWITDEPAVVVTVEPGSGLDRMRGAAGISDDYGGVPVDVAPASPVEQLRAQGATRGLRAAGVPIPGADLALPDWEREAGPETRGPADEGETRGATQEYEPPPGLSLDEVDDAMTLTCHCSPDAGWPTLKGFLVGTGHRLTVAMYDFTAPHIAKALADDMGQADGPLRLNLDPGMSLADPGCRSPTAAATRKTIPRRTTSPRTRSATTWRRRLATGSSSPGRRSSAPARPPAASSRRPTTLRSPSATARRSGSPAATGSR